MSQCEGAQVSLQCLIMTIAPSPHSIGHFCARISEVLGPETAVQFLLLINGLHRFGRNTTEKVLRFVLYSRQVALNRDWV